MKTTIRSVSTIVFISSFILLSGMGLSPAEDLPKQAVEAVASQQGLLAAANAEIILNKNFSSVCLPAKDSFYTEDLSFSADGIVEFQNKFFSDDRCQGELIRETLRQGHYSLALEEDAKWLLTIRQLRMMDERPSERSREDLQKQVAQHYEALIRVDAEQLVLENSPSSSLVYRAQLPTTL